MEYTTFKTALSESIRRQMGEEVRVEFHRLTVNNGVIREGMSIRCADELPVPMLYLEPYFTACEDLTDVEEAAVRLIGEWEQRQLEGTVPWELSVDFETASPDICCQLINYEKNSSVLGQVPHRSYLDLAVVYYRRMKKPLEGGMLRITNKQLAHWGISEEELYQNALRNTVRLLPASFQSIGQVLTELVCREGYGEPCACEFEAEGMYVLTNSEKYLGAAAILYPGVLEMIADRCFSRFYILPSSIHECIIVSGEVGIPEEELTALVRAVNQDYVAEEEVLSGRIYRYDGEMRKIFLI